jgi:hypothetical protein
MILKIRNARNPKRMAAPAMPIPIPAFAPSDNPPAEEPDDPPGGGEAAPVSLLAGLDCDDPPETEEPVFEDGDWLEEIDEGPDFDVVAGRSEACQLIW